MFGLGRGRVYDSSASNESIHSTHSSLKPRIENVSASAVAALIFCGWTNHVAANQPIHYSLCHPYVMLNSI